MDIILKITTPKTKKEGITINVNTNMTVGEVKEIYYKIVNSRINNQWLYDGGVLKDNDILSSYGIENFDIIEAHPSSKGGGGDSFGIDMADISNEKGLVKKNYGNAKKWHYITEGLNVSGICKNKSCEVFDKEVDCKIGFGTFDLVRQADEIKCPMCKEEIDPTTCVFCECQYKCEGKKKENGKTSHVNTEWKKVEKDYEYYDPIKSGTVKWLMLIIETKPL